MTDPPGAPEPLPSYAVDLLYDRAPEIERADLLRRLRERCGAAAPVDPTSPEGLNFYFPAYRVPFKGQDLPVQCFLRVSDEPVEPRLAAAVLTQTWDWPGARDVVARHRASVHVSDLLAAALPYRERLALFQNVLGASLEAAPAEAIIWRPCGRLVDPEAFLRSLERGDREDPIYGAVNVRIFPWREGGPGEFVMDTLGLSALGLPDLQCHFAGLDGGEVARVLYATARFVFDRGDVLEDGHSVPGIRAHERWGCRRGRALVPPERPAVDLFPGMTR
jgi:hypothetical protein